MADSGDDGTTPTPPEPPRKIHPISTLTRHEAVDREQRNAKLLADRERQKRAVAATLGPVTTLDGYKPKSLEEARDVTARALGEMLLQKGSLRRFRALLRSKSDKVALAAYELAIQHILATMKPGAGNDKPTQVIVNNMIARPVTLTPAPPASSITVEV